MHLLSSIKRTSWTVVLLSGLAVGCFNPDSAPGTGGSSPGGGGSSVGAGAQVGVGGGGVGGNVGAGGHIAGTGAQGGSTDRDTLNLIYQELRKLTESYSACVSSSSCELVAVGSKACGGPQEYWVYSTDDIAKEEMETVAEGLKSYERTYNEEHSVVSDCALVEPPQSVWCDGGTCRAE